MINNQLFYSILISLSFFILFADCQLDDAKPTQNSEQIQNYKKEVLENSPRQLPARGPKATLYYSKECQEEIIQHCPTARKNELSDLTVLTCIHNNVPDMTVINKDCQNILYMIKKNLTLSLKLDSSAITICKEDIPKLAECQNIDKENNGHLISCLLDNKENITGTSCQIFLKNIAALVFSDYRLVYKFVEDCQVDISRFSCGRIDKDEENGHQQGQTIECLSKKLQELDNKCKKQILRINELQSDDFHLDRPLYFACKDDREKFCDRISSGDGRVYRCLMKNKFNPGMSKQCQEQLTRRQKVIAEDVKADKSLVTACKQDILKHQCRQELRLHADQTIQLAGLILCLENAIQHGREVDADCKSELVEHRKILMSDYQLSPDVVRFCSNEIRQLCNNGVERNGKTLHCLLNQAKQNQLGKIQNNFSGKCYRTLQEFFKVVNAGEDVRIDPHLQASCQNLLNTYCKDVQPGKGRVIECLLKFIDSTSITDECEERLLEIQFFVARDWTLNTRLFDSCRQDAVDHCKAEGSWKDFGENAESIVPCLYHYIDDMNDDDSDPNGQEAEKSKVIISPKCTDEIRKMMRTRANRIELIPEVQENCARDLAKYCSEKESYAKGEEMRCLQKNYKNLEDVCKKAVKGYSIAESKDLSLDQILMNACLPIINQFCSDKRDDKEELLDCMIAQKNNPNINEKCRAGIEHHQLVNLEEIKFNTKFVRKCKKEIREHCYEKSTKPEIISCLSEIVLNDSLLEQKHRIQESCRDQLRYELLQMNEQIKLDPDLVKACQSDMSRLCQNVQPGKGRMLECLRTNREKLSLDCSAKLRKRDQILLVDQNVDYTLQTNCKNAIKEYCNVNSEDTIACLRKHLLKPTLEYECRTVVINRIMIQNKDFRLNPTLWKACLSDVQKQCAHEVANINNLDVNLNGQVLKCLKKSFVRNKLSKQCQVEIDQVIREAANVDYRLDPMVAENCMPELENFCSEKESHEKENCLRLAFHKQKIKEDSKCYDEVKRLILEGAADIFVDEELSNACAVDLVKYCNDIPPGASQQLKCLLNVKNENKKMSETCLEMLNSRQELWKLAKISDSLNGINDLAQLINRSEHRSYLFFVLFAFTLLIFAIGCMCRRGVLGERRLHKNK